MSVGLAELAPDGRLSYEDQMLAALVPTSDNPSDAETATITENLLYLTEKVRLDLLRAENRSLVQCMLVCREDSDGKHVLTEDLLVDILVREQVPPDKQVKYQELFHTYSKVPVSTGKFRYAVTKFLKEKEADSYVAILNDAFTIHKSGMKVGRKDLKGYRDARSFMEAKLFELDKASGSVEIAEGDLRAETEESVVEYEQRQAEPAKFEGIKTGIGPLDDLTNGAQPGEVWIFGGYTEVGKTFSIINAAHHTATKQAKNVVLATGEVVYHQFRRRLYLRHARDPRFGLPYGISADAFKRGTLTPQELQGYRAAMHDLKHNPNYGKIYLFQIPKGAGLDFISNKCNSINSIWPVEALYVDSLHLLIQSHEGKDFRINANRLIKDSKQFALNFDRQRGIPLFSPWHANRSSWEKAKETGGYTLSSWMEADELERSADLLMWLLKIEGTTESREIQAGVVKYRDGRKLKQFTLYEDFDASYLGTVSSNQSVPQAGAPTNLGSVITTAIDVHAQRAAELF